MYNRHLSKLTILSSALSLLLLLFTPLSYAKPGCCSGHGGVAGCNSATGHQLCKDGVSSPTCACDGKSTVNKTTKAKSTTNPSTMGSTTATPATATATTTSTTPTTTSTTINKIKGCCSRHGGVAKCDTSTGYQICKDGTHSTTCACTK